MRKAHAADVAERAAIKDAIGFIASIFIGVGQFAKREAETIPEARQLARELDAKFADTHRKALVYAILPTGNQIVVPESYEPAPLAAPTPSIAPAKQEFNMPTKQFSKRFNAQRAAKAALKNPKAAEGVHFTTKQSGDVWTFSLIKVEPPKAQKPAKVANPAKATTAAPEKPAGGKRAAVEAAAREGKLPTPPDFSAPTHARYRNKLSEVIALVKARDVKALKAFEINPISTSPKAIDRYRNLAVIALEAAA